MGYEESVTGALPNQPCSCLCRLFAREDSKHVVQIVGLRELQVDSVELLLEVILPHCSSPSTRKDIILLSHKYNGLGFRQRADFPHSFPHRSAGEGIGYPLQCSWASLVAQLVKNPPATWETWV